MRHLEHLIGPQRGDRPVAPYVALKLGTIVDVLDFGAKGGPDDVIPIQAAIDQVGSLGGGEVRCGALEYHLGGKLVQKTGVRLVGKGAQNTRLKLNAAANSAVLETLNFNSLTGGGSLGGPSDFALVGMTFDGNYGNQAGVPDGLDIYGYRYLIEDITVQNVQGYGYRSEWGQFGEFPMEATIRRVKVDKCGRHGFWFRGPHDTYGEDIVVVDAGQESDNTWDGFLLDGFGSGRWVNVHPWHRSAVANRMFSSARVESGGNEFIACHLEGGRRCLVQRGDRNLYKAMSIYGVFAANPMATIRGSHVFFEARIEDTVPSGAACLQIGESGVGGLFYSHLDVMCITAATNAVVVSQDDGRNTGIIKTISATNALSAALSVDDRIAVQRPDKELQWFSSLLSSHPTAGVGYFTGAGGTVTQATNKSTGVTLNKATGQITMNNAALAGDTTVSFSLTNSAIAAGDILQLNHISGGTAGSYLLNAQSVGGSATINVRNITTGSLSEAIVISFAVIKAVTA